MAKKSRPKKVERKGISFQSINQVLPNEMFKKIQKSYEVLSNPISRQAYDIENNMNDGADGHQVD